jgi:hypothetical protein
LSGWRRERCVSITAILTWLPTYQFKPGPYSSHALSNLLAVALLFCRGLRAATPAEYRQRVGV